MRTTRGLAAVLAGLFVVGSLLGCTAQAARVESPPPPATIAPPPYVVESDSGEQSPTDSTPAEKDAASDSSAGESSSDIKLISAKVVRVVDGDTAVFALAGGREEKVRFIGIDTPESTTKVEEYGKEAAAYTRRALPVGRSVKLEPDVEERDRYGRMLAYVWLGTPKQASESEIRSKMLNAKLALDGYAQQMTIQPNSKYADYFTEFVREARQANRGLWAGGSAEEEPAAASSSGGSGGSYIGNRNTMKFHEPSCSSVGQMNPNNQVPLSSRKQAIDGGYVPCKRCNP